MFGTGIVLSNEEEYLIKAIDNGYYPEKLYKYRPIDCKTLSIIENSEFWFAKSESFNDPFDCNLSEIINPCIGDLENHLRALGTISEINIERQINICKNNPEKIREIILDVRDDFRNNWGILSLSSVNDNILMWSHYASNHKGIVICLDIRKDPSFFLHPIKIKYQKSYTELNYLKDPYKASETNITIKSEDWSYEQEVRIYKRNFGLYKFKPCVISSIYFGVNTKPENIDKIMALCKDFGYRNIDFYQANKEHAAFKITFSKL